MCRYPKDNNISGPDILPLPIYSKDWFLSLDKEQWQKIIWKKLEKQVNNLQRRIYKASKAGELKRVKSLTKLLLRSSCSILLNIRRVTQDNSGKKTKGVDGKTYLNAEERLELANTLMKMAKVGWEGYKESVILRVYIPKKGSKWRPIGIATKCDAVVQGVVKTALEPVWEAKFTSESYGFRPAYSTHDAVQAIFNSINHQEKWVLDADIKGFFDNISHDFLMGRLEGTSQCLIRKWLKAGVLDGGQIKCNEKGTPQGGVISPLLANIALDGMEEYLQKEIRKLGSAKVAKSLIVVRFADDFVVLHKDREVVQQCQTLLEPWLGKRGLELSLEKTKIVHTTEGFDFLGFNIRHFKKPKAGYFARKDKGKQAFKTFIKPSADAIKEHKEAISEVVLGMRGQSQEKLIDALNPKIQGWANYNRHVVSSKVFSSIDNWMWHKTWRWAVRRHQTKSKRWVFKRYFRRVKTRTGQFATKTKALVRHAATKIERFVRIRKGKSVYDGDEIYWASRLARGYGDITPSKARRLKKQDGKCAYCLKNFKNGDLMETHHKKPAKEGGEDREDNLVLLHKHCHDQYHAQYSKQWHKQRRGDDKLASPYQEMSDIQAEIMGIV